MLKPITLSPSDFAFLWEECKCCFYLKHVSRFNRPGGPFPGIFGVIDREMRKHYLKRRTEEIAPGLPPGTLAMGEKWVQSAPFTLPGHQTQLVLRGKLDAVAAFDDGTYGVIDFKTSDIRSTHIQLYSRQLRAYTYALEHPAPGKLALAPISTMGLLAFTPDAYTAEAPGRSVLSGALKWHPIRHNEASFMAFLDDVLTVLELPAPPEPGEKCQWCQYRASSRENGL
ncbi:MAG: PD-(D/E)XK nuclease family protein [Anaerolineae bacterium]|nr:PD-(D/E)XK nuclease family protein [Anaerolineae bacterium]